MKKQIRNMSIVALLLCGTVSSQAFTIHQKVGSLNSKITFFGFAQLQAVGGRGIQLFATKNQINKAKSNVGFSAQRVRFGFKYKAGNFGGMLQLDFDQKYQNPNQTNGASLPNVIKDAFVYYHFNNMFILSGGIMKMPNGMSFLIPGWALDIAQRGFDKSLVLERELGIEVSGKKIAFGSTAKLGYNIMVANQASRSKAAGSSAMGGNSYALRGSFDYTPRFHLEASYGLSQNASGKIPTTGVDYHNINVGVESNLNRLGLKAEYIGGYNILGQRNWNERTLSATVGYFVTPTFELVTKSIQAESKNSAGHKTFLGNTFLGFNYYIDPAFTGYSNKDKKARNRQKFVFNYIIANGSGATPNSANKWNGLSGYLGNAFIVQYQFKF